MTIPADIKPNKQHRVMDLAREAGIDVSNWKNYKNGANNPAANPKYCYEWAFVEPGKVVVLNLWYRSMNEVSGRVEQHLNIRKGLLAETNPTRRARHRRMEAAIQLAFQAGLPIRVIVLYGDKRKLRLLDTQPWAVAKLNERTGEIILARGLEAPHFADQFSLPPPTDGTTGVQPRVVNVRDRSPFVRQFALARSNGKCELCGIDGFLLPDGRLYLETHHVAPLAEGGSDSHKNVVALCPNHHREAHYGNGKLLLRDKLAEILTSR